MQWTKTAPLQELHRLRVGIDGAYFIRKLQSTKEPCLMATGGLPLSFTKSFEEEIKRFTQLGVDLFFVFNGLPFKKERPFSVDDRRPNFRAQGWESYTNGKHEAAYSQWSSAGSVPQSDLLFLAFHVLDKLQIPYIRAPYSALGQLAYMDTSPAGYFHAVYAGSEYLLFPTDRVITSFDFSKSSFSYIEKKTVLTALAITNDQFLDMGLLAGFDYISTFPGLLDQTSSGFSFQLAVDAVRSNGSGFAVVQKSLNNPAILKMNYLDLFAKTRVIVKNHIVWTDKGYVSSIDPENAPIDLVDIIGPKLPTSIYYSLVHCIISPQILQNLTTGLLVESHPLCSGNLEELQKFILSSEITRLRAQSLAFLNYTLQEKFVDVESYYWFDPQHGHKISFGQEILSFDTPKKWFLSDGLLKEASIAYKKFDQNSLDFCFGFFSNPTFAKYTTSPLKKSETMSIGNELILAQAMALSQCNYIDTKNHQLTFLGLALSKAITNNPSEDLAEHLWTFCELLKSGAFQVGGYVPSFDLGVKASELVSARHIWLLSRLACILPIKSKKAVPYQGPLFRDLVGFHAFMRAMTRSLRNLCEMALLARLVDSMALQNLSPNLPFSEDTSTIFGILVATYLQKCVESGIDQALKHVTDIMGAYVTNVKDELASFFRFWKSLIFLMKEGKNALGKYPSISADILNFAEAEEWVSKFEI